MQVAKVSKILMSLDKGEVPENINSGDLLNENVSNQQDTEDIQGDYKDHLLTEGATKMFSNDGTIHVDETDPSQNMSLHSNKGKVYT